MIERIFYTLPPYTNKQIEDKEILLLNNAKIMIYNIWAIPVHYLGKQLKRVASYRPRLSIPRINIKKLIWVVFLWVGRLVGWTFDLISGAITHFMVGYYYEIDTLDNYEKEITRIDNEHTTKTD